MLVVSGLLVQREVAVVRPLPLRRLVLEALIHQRLARVYAQNEQRRLHAVVRGRVADVRHLLAALALDGEDAPLVALLGEAVDLIGVVAAAVDAGAQDGELRPVLLAERRRQEGVQIAPHLFLEHIAVYLLVADAPVVLNVHASRQHQHILRHLSVVYLAAVHQFGVFQPLARLLPGLAQLRVHPGFHLLRVALVQHLLGKQELFHDLLPPAEG